MISGDRPRLTLGSSRQEARSAGRSGPDFPGRVDRTERLYKIDQLLKDSKLMTFARFQEALGVSRATLKRDLE